MANVSDWKVDWRINTKLGNWVKPLSKLVPLLLLGSISRGSRNGMKGNFESSLMNRLRAMVHRFALFAAPVHLDDRRNALFV